MPARCLLPERIVNIYPIPLPEQSFDVTAVQLQSGEVVLEWPRNRHTWGLSFDIYRGETSDFEVCEDTRIATTLLSRFVDLDEIAPGENLLRGRVE